MDRKRCAVVGIGHRFHSWIPQIVTTYTEQAELVALCDPVVERCYDVNEYFDAGSGFIVHSDHSIPPEVEHDSLVYFFEQGANIPRSRIAVLWPSPPCCCAMTG